MSYIVRMPAALIFSAVMVSHSVLGAPFVPSRSLTAEETKIIRGRLVGFGDVSGAPILGRLQVEPLGSGNSTRTTASIIVVKSCRRSGEYCVTDAEEFGGECNLGEDLMECITRLSVNSHSQRFIDLGCEPDGLPIPEYSDLVSIGEMAEEDIGIALNILWEAVNPTSQDRIIEQWPFVDPVIFQQPTLYLSSIDFHREVGYQRLTALFVLDSSRKVSVSIDEEDGQRTVEFFRVVR